MRLHLKVPNWLLDLNALLTKKFPIFLSRLNELSGGRGGLVSCSLRRILQFFEKDIFDCRILWMLGEGEWILLVSSLCDVSSVVSRRFLGRDVCLWLQRSRVF